MDIAVVLFITGTLVETYSYLSTYLSWVSYKSIFLTTRNRLFFGLSFIAIGKVIAENNYKTKWWLLITSVLATMAEGYYLVFGINKVIVYVNILSLILVPSIIFI